MKSRMFSLLLLAASALTLTAQSLPPQEIPSFTAYAEPNPESMEIADSGPISNWTDAQTTIAWYGLIRTTGQLDVSIKLHVNTGEAVKLRMKVGDHELPAKTIHGADGLQTISFGSLTIKDTGGYRFALSGIKKSNTSFGELDSLELTGDAAKDSLFNLTPQRGAPSVHLSYPIPDGIKAQWFYNEVTVKADPIWSYYMACGFARGYFGIQVNSPTERRIIFSVWDSGKEAVDRNKVSEADKVQLIAKGDGVVASGFGNEGTGGHSHLVYPWKTGDTYRFLVSAQPEGDTTIYSGYFYFPEKHAWGLIASFRAPKDGNYLSHLYSFNEDFSGANGQQLRLAEFGNQWIRTTDGKWIELTKARFTHTARGLYKDRIDRAAGVTGNNFFLTNGGFKASSMQFNDEVNRPGNGRAPDILPADLPGIPASK